MRASACGWMRTFLAIAILSANALGSYHQPHQYARKGNSTHVLRRGLYSGAAPRLEITPEKPTDGFPVVPVEEE